METLRTVRNRLLRTRNQARFRSWSTCATKGRHNAQRLRGLKDHYRGRRCFVMGNGPTLLKCDLNQLSGEVTIVSNAHYLIWDRLTYVPTLLTVEDKLVAEDRGQEIRGLKGITKVLPFDLHDKLGEADRDTVYVYFERLYRGLPKFSFDLRRVAYWGGTVSFFNLQLAAYLGCNPIVLIGFDHSYRYQSTSSRTTSFCRRRWT